MFWDMFPEAPAYHTSEGVVSVHQDNSEWDESYGRVAMLLDHLTVYIALGCVTMLLVVQGLLLIPRVHQTVDAWRSGFVAVPAEPAGAAISESATIRLSLAPDSPSSDVSVLVAGKKVADFAKGTVVNISVQPSSHITVENQSSHTVYVTVDDSSAALLVPAPGQRVIVGPNSLANFPSTQFQNTNPNQ